MRNHFRLWTLLLTLTLLFFIPACSSETSTEDSSETQSENQAEETQEENTAANTNAKAAILYFSKTGNTKKVADMIAEATGADLIEIKPVNAYPEDYDQTVDQAKKEQEENARPEITTDVTDFSGYDTVFLGVPVWWGDLPMPVYTFLDQYDLSGKTVGVFTTHHGSGLGSTVESVTAAEPGANIVEGLDVYDEEIDASKEEVTDWAKSVLDAPKES